jgi:hypothetical protein
MKKLLAVLSLSFFAVGSSFAQDPTAGGPATGAAPPAGGAVTTTAAAAGAIALMVGVAIAGIATQNEGGGAVPATTHH